jgi:hypothetical protein
MKFNKMLFLKLTIILLGIILAVLTGLYGAYPSMWYVLWALLPYGAYYLASLKLKSRGAIIGGGLFILGVDILIRIQIFYLPSSSTDSIALVTMPFWESIIIMPVGFLFGWLIEKGIIHLRSKGI